MMRLTRAESLAAVLGLGAVAFAPATASAANVKSLDPILNYAQWLDARPNATSLHGRVVLVDVFTFGCYNCANITPNLRTLHKTKPQSDLVIVGVHTPETPYERDRANVVTSLKRLRITWPVAIDNDSKLWNAYGVEYWPTQLIFDRSGKLRWTVTGDSQDAEVNKTVAALIAEAAPSRA